MSPLPVVKFDEAAIRSVRHNNQQVVDAAEDDPLKGGNIDAYAEVGDKDLSEPIELFEQTVFGWHGDGTAMHFVAYQLVMFHLDKRVERGTE